MSPRATLKDWLVLAFVAMAVVCVIAYVVTHMRPAVVGGFDPSKENKTPNLIATAQEEGRIVSADYFRASSNASGTTLTWAASGAKPGECSIDRYSGRPQASKSDKTYPVEPSGDLMVDDGYYYRLACHSKRGGEAVTIQADLDLLPVSAN